MYILLGYWLFSGTSHFNADSALAYSKSLNPTQHLNITTTLSEKQKS